ncbi:MAG TPA: type IV toxin-antitoxin system AbiEi family antitoxin domain-containing protein [Solirubrobacterales bacterium]|jgi:very-short-patch-repair endonuclease|nr:type IV toxin-antitoxin system AbiEi family antitoxin domain-containing protein [Solirubrobacterales bacterium]
MALARRQQGVVSRGQMRRLGFSDGRIDDWSREGRLWRVFHGVYAVESTALTEQGRILAAVLACGSKAVVSHRSAAFLLGVGERSPRVIDLIAPGRRGRAIDGIRIHDVAYPAPSELVRIHGIPCTNAARTIVDLAGIYGEAQMRRIFERAATRRVLDLKGIDAILAGGPRRRGAPCLRRVIETWRPVVEKANYKDVRSLFEAKLLPLIAAAKLPMPQVNALVHTEEETFEVDLFWPQERFVVEADSRLHHTIEVAFERDRHRDRELLAVHYAVLRVTWREAEYEPTKVFDVVRGELKRRAPRDPGGSFPELIAK